MTARQLLTRLRQAGAQLRAEGEQLHCSAPPGALDDELRAALARLKPELLVLLNTGASASTLVPIQPAGQHPPLFAVPGHNGDVYCWVRLARQLGRDRPLYGLQPPEPPLCSIPALAARLLEDVRRRQPEGPYRLAGYCAGGTVAFEMARQLEAAGARVAFLGLFESPAPAHYRAWGRLRCWLLLRRLRLSQHLAALRGMNIGQRVSYLGQAWRRLIRDLQPAPPATALEQATLAALGRYRPGAYSGSAVHFFASDFSRRHLFTQQLDWRRLVGRLEIEVGPEGCYADDLLLDPHAAAIADLLRRRLD